jgi:vacuolar-type H+-ATPase subunit I/STV1
MLEIKAFSGLFCCTTLLLVLSMQAQSRDLYRYTNNEGNMVVDDRVPTEYAGRGYEVINEDGIVLKVVPRELTAEELERLNVEQQLKQVEIAEKERLQKWDETLLLRYSTIEDIEAARDRALSDLRIRVSILKSNTRFLKQQVENHQAVAADIERNGGTVDVSRLAAIEDLQSEIAATERSIADREAEVVRAEDKFQMDIDRFQMLLDVVKLRRNVEAAKK